MLTVDEKNELIKDVIEQVLLKMPEVIGNLMSHHANMAKVKREFKERFPEFNNHSEVVARVIEKVEGENVGLSSTEILNKAVPEIRRQLKIVEKVDLNSVVKPAVDNLIVSIDSDNGAI